MQSADVGVLLAGDDQGREEGGRGAAQGALAAHLLCASIYARTAALFGNGADVFGCWARMESREQEGGGTSRAASVEEAANRPLQPPSAADAGGGGAGCTWPLDPEAMDAVKQCGAVTRGSAARKTCTSVKNVLHRSKTHHGETS
eukprot:2888963-Rhodomonas_salina.1